MVYAHVSIVDGCVCLTGVSESVCLSAVVGRQCFREFLKSEFSEENIEFWIACDEYKQLKTMTTNLTARAQKIFAEFIVHQAPREVVNTACDGSVLSLTPKTEQFGFCNIRFTTEEDSFEFDGADPP